MLIFLDIYKRQAKFLAWYDQEGEPSTHNPFKKFRARPRRSDSIQLESNLAHSRTADEIRSSEERRRRADMASDLSGPEHADTFPSTSSAGDQFSRPETGDKSEPVPSTRSFEPINVSSSNEVDRDANKPRKRKTFLGKFVNHAEDDEGSSTSHKPMPDKHKFTTMGQLKATVFNSWMNILILAAPVGSEWPAIQIFEG